MSGKGVLVGEDTLESAGQAVHGIECGRRVGWAKAFEAIRRADSAERDVNVLRADNRILAGFAARTYGTLEQLVGVKRIDALFRGDNHDFKGYFPQGPLNQGRDAGRRLLGQQADELARLRTAIASHKAELTDLIHTGDHLKLGWLMKRFAIPSEDELMAWLARYESEH